MIFKHFKYKDIYHYPTNIMLNITDNCNLQCRYCFVEQHPHYMMLDVAKKAVDWTVNNYKIKRELGLLHPHEMCSLNFFGGEPMLMFDQIIVPLTYYINENYPNIFTLGMTTNCTLLSKEKIDFLYENQIHILASIDGPEDIQCYNRPCRNGDNSSKLIEKNVSYLLEKFPYTVFRATGYAPTIDRLFESYLYAESLGFKTWVIVPNTRNEWTEQQFNDFEQELSKIYMYKLQKQLNNESYVNVDAPDSLKKGFYLMVNKKHIRNKNGILRCGLGTLTCAIGWDGKIYGCQQDVSFNDKNLMYIGDLYNGGINKQRHIKLLKKFVFANSKYPYNKKECKNCLLREYCSNIGLSSCPSNGLGLLNDFGKINKTTCRCNQIMLKQYLTLNSVLSYIDKVKKEEEEK